MVFVFYERVIFLYHCKLQRRHKHWIATKQEKHLLPRNDGEVAKSWLSHLESLPTKLDNKSLENITRVAQRLNLLPLKPLVITVAGTNGKGSCVALLEKILLSANYAVGAYTSPHLFFYNERIRINGSDIDDKKLCEAFEEIEQARQNISLSYFEFSTLAALLIFQHTNLDVVILEVGMGGRYDAVNIIDPALAIITSIDLDHTAQLGNNRELIGFEKAGIMRNNIPTVSGDFDTPHSIRDHATQLSAPLYCQSKDFGYNENAQTWSYWSRQQTLENLPLPNIALQNAATVLKGIELLSTHLYVTPQNISAGLAAVFVPGRLQIIHQPIQQIFDVAHNPAAATLFAHQLRQLTHNGKTFAILGMLNDKDQIGTIMPLIPLVDHWFVGSLASVRSCSAQQLTQQVRAAGATTVTEFITITDAYRAAYSRAVPGDRLIIFGSFYTVAETLKIRL